MACDNCFFGGKQISSRGPVDSPFVIIGESPGLAEISQGKPFMGSNYKMIEDSLTQAGCDVEPYVALALNCFPKVKDPKKLSQATKICSSRLHAELTKHPRKVILAFGNAALWAATGNYDLKITKERGKLFPSEFAEIGVVACMHPAFLMRGGGSWDHFKKDINYAVSLLKGGDIKKPVTTSYKVIEMGQQVKEFSNTLKALGKTPVAADIETGGFDFMHDRVLGIGISWDPSIVYIIPEGLIIPEVFENRCKWIWHNGKFDIKFLWHIGCKEARVDHDTMLMSYALNEKRGIHDLEQVASDWLGAPSYKNMLDPYLKNKKSSYADIPKDVLYKYLAFDVSNTLQLYSRMYPQICKDVSTKKCYDNIFIPASNYLARVENNGMYVDIDWVNNNKQTIGGDALKYEQTLNTIAQEIMGRNINPRSPLQLKKFLYGFLKLGHIDQSTDEDTLGTLPDHPAVVALKAYRKVHKGLSTYVKPALELLNPSTKRIHTTYLIHGTVTGRLASRNPNMQNIPRNPILRGQYIAAPDNVFIECDLNQAELRSLACLSGDKNLCDIYTTEGKSIHDEVRDQLFGIPSEWSEEQTSRYYERFNVPEGELKRLRDEQKMIAKNVNFGIVYGITPFGLKDQTGAPVHECEQYINAWFNRFPDAKRFIDRCKDAAAKGQTISTVFGRKKRMGVVTQDRLRDLQNEASNFPHQSIASDITLLTGIRIEHILWERWGAFIVNTVHDSILIEVKDTPQNIIDVKEYVCSELAETPRIWGLNRVPFKADAKVGKRWGHLEGQ